jgi:hypothetical protein
MAGVDLSLKPERLPKPEPGILPNLQSANWSSRWRVDIHAYGSPVPFLDDYGDYGVDESSRNHRLQPPLDWRFTADGRYKTAASPAADGASSAASSATTSPSALSSSGSAAAAAAADDEIKLPPATSSLADSYDFRLAPFGLQPFGLPPFSVPPAGPTTDHQLQLTAKYLQRLADRQTRRDLRFMDDWPRRQTDKPPLPVLGKN